MKIIVIKLTTGDEVIGTLVEEDESCYTIAKARTLVMQQAEGGQIGLGMMPFMPSADNPETDTESDIRIYKSFVVAEPVGVPIPLEKAYTRTTSTIAVV